MDRRITASVNSPTDTTIAALADLATYPEWLDLVQSAEVAGSEPAWNITLRARLGPLARSKRLRMARTLLTDERVRFERREIDGRDHAEWTLEARVTPDHRGGPQVSLVEVRLHYGGSLWSAPIEAALAGFEASAAERLDAHLSARPSPADG